MVKDDNIRDALLKSAFEFIRRLHSIRLEWDSRRLQALVDMLRLSRVILQNEKLNRSFHLPKLKSLPTYRSGEKCLCCCKEVGSSSGKKAMTSRTYFCNGMRTSNFCAESK